MNSSGRHSELPLLGRLGGLRFPLLGLFGEVGSLLSALKRKQRDQAPSTSDTARCLSKSSGTFSLALLLHCLCQSFLSDLVVENFHPRTIGTKKFPPSSPSPTFNPFMCSVGTLQPHSVFEQRLIELAGKVGRLLDGRGPRPH